MLTNDADLAARVRRLRAHGAAVKYYHDELGVNSRLDEIQAAILRVKLRHLERWIERRSAVAAAYTHALRKLGEVTTSIAPEHARHAYHQFTIRVSQRDAVSRRLSELGIQTMVYYPVPLHLQLVHQGLGYDFGYFPESERAAAEVLSLPMFPELLDEEVGRVVEALETMQPLAVG